jgi:hypothetical protein
MITDVWPLQVARVWEIGVLGVIGIGYLVSGVLGPSGVRVLRPEKPLMTLPLKNGVYRLDCSLRSRK